MPLGIGWNCVCLCGCLAGTGTSVGRLNDGPLDSFQDSRQQSRMKRNGEVMEAYECVHKSGRESSHFRGEDGTGFDVGPGLRFEDILSTATLQIRASPKIAAIQSHGLPSVDNLPPHLGQNALPCGISIWQCLQIIRRFCDRSVPWIGSIVNGLGISANVDKSAVVLRG
jgi:hypothetical protein